MPTSSTGFKMYAKEEPKNELVALGLQEKISGRLG
jgi:hypothetical protein